MGRQRKSHPESVLVLSDKGFRRIAQKTGNLTGDTLKAIETQKKTISLLPEGESSLRTSLEEALAKFEAALNDEKQNRPKEQ